VLFAGKYPVTMHTGEGHILTEMMMEALGTLKHVV
jgi:hypothetical protein